MHLTGLWEERNHLSKMSKIEETNSGSRSGQPINPDNFEFNKAVSTEDNVMTSEDYRNLEGKLAGNIFIRTGEVKQRVRELRRPGNNFDAYIV